MTIYICVCVHRVESVERRVATSIKVKVNKSKYTPNRHVESGERRVAMGRLRSVGSKELYVSFAEYRLFYRALLQKRPII